SGLVLVAKSNGTINLPAVAAFGIRIVGAMLQHLKALGLNERVEEVLVTLGQQIHLIRPLARAPGVLFYVCLSKSATRLGMARAQVRRIEEGLMA
ncbi:roadblock/LC7 domain-containing protein, partial [Acinetobacter baumannii]|uniref:roadblock/LC7 domain-containing protein n=1 Tax=Acinetobacter baumannii TaxID=470 RepID=UPI0018E098D4